MEVGTSTSAEARKGHKWWTRDVVARGLFLFLVVPVHVLVILAYLWGVGPLSCACGGSGGSGGSGGGGGQPIVLSPSSLAQPAHIRSAPLSAEASTSAFTSDTSNSESTEENAVRCFSSVRSCFLWPDGSLQSHCPPSAPPSTPTPSSRRLSNSGTSDVSSSDASDTSDTIETITTSHTPPRRLADTEHPAYGQHLLLDLYAADAALLNDKDALLAAMTQVVQTLGMTVLGAVNAQLQPQGVSVTIALAESHFTAHTYPEVRSVFVDLFTCGETELLPHLPLIASAFGASLADTAHAKWSFVRRGVRKLEGVSDLDFELVQMHSEKRIVYSGDTAFQHVDIVDIRGDEYWGFQTNKEEGIGEWSRSLFMGTYCTPIYT
ncbi:S-adenosylmethionine decarboxylase-domain-containing protein [Ochromonadaceae sp. CCMP2298]|nr:S-adenosylmethionine decarboxylase-domain-containing protein [Ochromonadaceae sp. CCMP2298]